MGGLCEVYGRSCFETSRAETSINTGVLKIMGGLDQKCSSFVMKRSLILLTMPSNGR